MKKEENMCTDMKLKVMGVVKEKYGGRRWSALRRTCI